MDAANWDWVICLLIGGGLVLAGEWIVLRLYDKEERR